MAVNVFCWAFDAMAKNKHPIKKLYLKALLREDIIGLCVFFILKTNGELSGYFIYIGGELVVDVLVFQFYYSQIIDFVSKACYK